MRKVLVMRVNEVTGSCFRRLAARIRKSQLVSFHLRSSLPFHTIAFSFISSRKLLWLDYLHLTSNLKPKLLYSLNYQQRIALALPYSSKSARTKRLALLANSLLQYT